MEVNYSYITGLYFQNAASQSSNPESVLLASVHWRINTSMSKRKSTPSVESYSNNRSGTKADACRDFSGGLYTHATEQKAWELYSEDKSLPSLIMPPYLIKVRILYQITS